MHPIGQHVEPFNPLILVNTFGNAWINLSARFPKVHAMTSSGVSSQTKGLFRKVSLILNISSIKGWIPILELRECFHYRQTRYRSWTDWGSSLPSIRNNGPTHFHNWDLIECCLTGASWPGLGELSNSRLASRYQLVNLNNRGKFGKWKDIALCVTDMFLP